MVRPFRLKHHIEVGKPVETTDRFGTVTTSGAVFWSVVDVAGWWVHNTQESQGDSVLRTIDTLTVLFPHESRPSPNALLRLPDSTVWEVEGHPEDYDHGPFGFVPGLVVVHARRTEG